MMVPVKLPRSETSLHYVSDKVKLHHMWSYYRRSPSCQLLALKRASETIQINDHLNLNVQNTNLAYQIMLTSFGACYVLNPQESLVHWTDHMFKTNISLDKVAD